MSDFGLHPRFVEDTRQQGDGDWAQIVQEAWMDFVWSCCFGRTDITKGCFDLVCYEALTYLWIHHLTPQPTIRRLLHSSLVILNLEAVHIPVKSYKAVSFSLLTDKVFTIVGYDSSGWHTSICGKATQDWSHLFLRFFHSHLPLPNPGLPFAGEVLYLCL